MRDIARQDRKERDERRQSRKRCIELGEQLEDVEEGVFPQEGVEAVEEDGTNAIPPVLV
jgi:hypothetical protein